MDCDCVENLKRSRTCTEKLAGGRACANLLMLDTYCHMLTSKDFDARCVPPHLQLLISP